MFALDVHDSLCHTLKLPCGFVSQSFPNFVIPVYFVYWFNDHFPLTTRITNLNVYRFFSPACRYCWFYISTPFQPLAKKVCMLKTFCVFVCDFCYDFICSLINTNTLFVWWLSPSAGCHRKILSMHRALSDGPYITLRWQCHASFTRPLVALNV